MLHTFVGFVADFPVRDDGVEPAGRELAVFVQDKLNKQGFSTSPARNREGWAWDMQTTKGNLKITTIVGLVDDMESRPPRQWLITNNSPIPFLKKIFGRKQFAREREAFLLSFCNAIHKIMQGDSRFSHIAWYREDTFDKPGDVPADKPANDGDDLT